MGKTANAIVAGTVKAPVDLLCPSRSAKAVLHICDVLDHAMPLLNWSPRALAALTRDGQRERMARWFEAYFRVAGEEGQERLAGTVLPLDLPGEIDIRYRFRARFTRGRGWVVEAELKHEHRKIRSRGPLDAGAPG